MEVQLYVYDLSRGIARSMSQQFLGIQLDAVYHTSLVFENIEYFFGAGVQTCYAGSTHHGRPMEIIAMGETHLPLETILDYLESLKEVYTPESYDLFAHNCNNFTNDFAMFLVGKGIPAHITSLPKRVLETPFGQMLKPQIEASMRSVTQAPVPSQNVPPAGASQESGSAHPRNGEAGSVAPPQQAVSSAGAYGHAANLTDSAALEKAMSNAVNTCATIFFTSSTCAPCKIAYPVFDLLAEEYPNSLFVKVDINEARDIAARYQIRATPTFMTFSKGEKLDEWSGADPRQLRVNVEQLVQTTFPPHPHTTLQVPILQYGSLKPITYPRVPPLEKLTGKLGDGASRFEIVALQDFVQQRQQDPREAALPDLQNVSTSLRKCTLKLPVEVRFAAIDLLRCALVDPRASGFFAEEQQDPLIPALITQTLELEHSCPHNLRLVTIHLASNMFTSPLYSSELFKSASSTSTSLLIQLVTTSLLDAAHSTARVAAASLAFNLAVSNYLLRREEGEEGLAESEEVELAASILEALGNEESSEEATKVLLLTIGYLLYCAPREGELVDLMQAMDAKSTLKACKGDRKLINEVMSLL